MSPQCPICLHDLSDSVCPPCGHVFCNDCLRRAVRQTRNGTQAPCPCCRKEFPIATPLDQILTPPFYPFIMDPIRRVFIASDDSQDQQNIRQCDESLGRENRELKRRVQELEVQQEWLLASILRPSFAGPDLDPVHSSVASNLSNSRNIEGNSAHPRGAPFLAPQPQFIDPRLLASNAPNSGHTVVGMFPITGPETRPTLSAHPNEVPMSSTMSNAASTSVFTNPFARPESQHSILSAPARQWGSGQASMDRSSFVNTGGTSLSGPNTAGQWTVTVPSNRALNAPNQRAPLAAPHFLNSIGTRQSFLRRESQPRMATPTSAGQGPSVMDLTMIDVPKSLSSSDTGSRRSSQSQ